jgi:hypothetical protein
VGLDIGLAIYTNPAPQFQHMGISSNRLCMFLAMGVPVIATRQPSFRFIEDYNCGILVENYDQFLAAIRHIGAHLPSMWENCHRCFNEYIMPPDRFPRLREAIASLHGSRTLQIPPLPDLPWHPPATSDTVFTAPDARPAGPYAAAFRRDSYRLAAIWQKR